MQATLTFLGTGTSMGVPTLGCHCAVCSSTDARNQRLRPSVMLRFDESGRERTVLIDTGPDFRTQALRAGIDRVDAVFYTHAHVDHIFGLDDLRPLSFVVHREGGTIPLFADEPTQRVLERVYDYTLAPGATYPNRARVQLMPLDRVTSLYGVEFVTVPLLHGAMEIAGFRFGGTAYLTDVSHIPDASLELLGGLDHLILSALRHKPHPNHTTVAQAIDWAQRIGARQTWLTHIAHELDHAETEAALPETIHMAYDGLSLAVNL